MQNIKIISVTIDRQISAESILIYVTYEYNGVTRTDNGSLYIVNNSYYPGLDLDNEGNEAEYYALQKAIENR